MKTDRQKIILEVISGQNVGTQQQLLELLSARGVRCTQATLSRDIHALNLVKLPGPGGGVHYGVEPTSAVGNDARKLLNIARLASLSIEAAGNIIVIKTMPGLAHAVAWWAASPGTTPSCWSSRTARAPRSCAGTCGSCCSAKRNLEKNGPPRRPINKNTEASAL